METVEVMLAPESFLQVAARAMRGWKKRRIKRALKQIKRNIKGAEGVQFEMEEACIRRPVAEASTNEAPPVTLAEIDQEYSGDVAGLIEHILECGHVRGKDKLRELLRYLRKSDREPAADVIQATMGQFNGDVNESCRIDEFLKLLDKAPARPPASDPTEPPLRCD